MKIALVSLPASPLVPPGEAMAGGQNVHVAGLAAALAGLGHQVTVYTRRDDEEPLARVRPAPRLTVVHVPAGPAKPLGKHELLPVTAAFGEFLAGQWRKTRPDIVHAHYWLSGLASMRAASAVGSPVVQTFHGLGAVERRHCRHGEADPSPPERVELERLLGKQVAKVAATASDEVFELARMGVPRTRISLVPGGVDVDLFTADGPGAAERNGTPRLVAVGRLAPRKGLDDVIAALARVPTAVLMIAGGPVLDRLLVDKEAVRLRKLARAFGVAERVRMLGRVSRTDLPALLRSASAVVCVPWYEPFGNVALEAMACGVPVVAAAVGGLTDTVVDGVTGLHVPPRRPDALAAALRSLLADPTSREAFGLAGNDRVRARYSWNRVAADMLRVYDGAIAEHRRHPWSLTK